MPFLVYLFWVFSFKNYCVTLNSTLNTLLGIDRPPQKQKTSILVGFVERKVAWAWSK